jgi:hypothetical protein
MHRTRIMADHNLECQEFWKQESVDAIIVDKIVREAVDTAYVEELDDDYIGYGAQTIKSILEHVHTEWCVVTTLEKNQAAAAFHVQWDLSSHIMKFARELDKQQKPLPRHWRTHTQCHQGSTLCQKHVLF